MTDAGGPEVEPRNVDQDIAALYVLLHGVRGAVAEISKAIGRDGAAEQYQVELLERVADGLEGVMALGAVATKEAEITRERAVEALTDAGRDEERLFGLFQAFLVKRGDGISFSLAQLEDYFAENGEGFEPGELEVYFPGWQQSAMDIALEERRHVRWAFVPGAGRRPRMYALAPIVRKPAKRVVPPAAAKTPDAPKPAVKTAPPATRAKGGERVVGPATHEERTDGAVDAQAVLERRLQIVTAIVADNEQGRTRARRLYLTIASRLGVEPEEAAGYVRLLKDQGLIFRVTKGGNTTYTTQRPAVKPPRARPADTQDGERSDGKGELTDEQKRLAKTVLRLLGDVLRAESSLLEPRQIYAALVEQPDGPRTDIDTIKYVCRRMADLKILKAVTAKEGTGRRARAKRAQVLKIGFASRDVMSLFKLRPNELFDLIDSGVALSPE